MLPSGFATPNPHLQTKAARRRSVLGFWGLMCYSYLHAMYIQLNVTRQMKKNRVSSVLFTDFEGLSICQHAASFEHWIGTEKRRRVLKSSLRADRGLPAVTFRSTDAVNPAGMGVCASTQDWQVGRRFHLRCGPEVRIWEARVDRDRSPGVRSPE